jgi:hypothetical protein
MQSSSAAATSSSSPSPPTKTSSTVSAQKQSKYMDTNAFIELIKPHIIPHDTKTACLIGSRAAQYWMGDSFRAIDSKTDYDFIMTPKLCVLFLEHHAKHIDLFKYEEHKLPIEKEKKKVYDKKSDAGVKDVKSKIDSNVGTTTTTAKDVSPTPSATTNTNTDTATITTVGTSAAYKINLRLKECIAIEIEVPVSMDHSSFLILQTSWSSVKRSRGGRSFPFLNLTQVYIPPLELLERIKYSHIYWPNQFTKHIYDLHAMRQYIESSGSCSSSLKPEAEQGQP